MKKIKKYPDKFKDEDEEREFWANHSPLDYFDIAKIKKASFPNLKPALRSISLRLPEDMIDDLKVIANKQDVPYQSLAKIFLAREIKREQNSMPASNASIRKRRSA